MIAETHTLHWQQCGLVQHLQKTYINILSGNIKMFILIDPAITLLGIYPN